MRFQPYYGFVTGLHQVAWDRLSASEQRDLLKRGKSRKGKRPPAPEEESQDEIVLEPLSLPIRAIPKEELDQMPQYRA